MGGKLRYLSINNRFQEDTELSEFTISGAMFRDMILTGAALLEQNRETIDALNVFPVPDGDTGTNMSMTMQSAVKSVNAQTSDRACDVAAALSQGALRGARGNSGVILSQIFRGFQKALAGSDVINEKLFCAAFATGADAAYRAVTKPKEGTILTVIRAISDALKKAERSRASLVDMIDVMIDSGEAALAKTPELLPVLKEAGVVDSGGKGLVTILRGFRMAINGENAEETVIDMRKTVAESFDEKAEDGPESIKYYYNISYSIINLFKPLSDDELKKYTSKLEGIGTKVCVEAKEKQIECSMQTCVPGKALQYALMYGEIDGVSIENLLEKARKKQLKRAEERKEYAIIAVSAGAGLDAIFRDLGASGIISGGQTMNPSIETIANAVREVNARHVFVLPNNSNIIMAVQQAAEITTDCKVYVVPTKTIMQGISALMSFNTDNAPDVNRRNMEKAAENVVSGSVTYAVRSTTFEGRQIDEGDILGMMNNKIQVTGKDVMQVSQDLLREMMKEYDDEYATATILYGEGITEEQANELAAALEDEYPDADFVVQSGGQPLYYFYMSVE